MCIKGGKRSTVQRQWRRNVYFTSVFTREDISSLSVPDGIGPVYVTGALNWTDFAILFFFFTLIQKTY